jgi:transposase
VLASIRYLFPWLRHVFADGAYDGEKLKTALAGLGQWTLEIVKRSDQPKGFEVLPRRWVVERTFGWFGRNRRLAKDFERPLPAAKPGYGWLPFSCSRAGSRGRIQLTDIFLRRKQLLRLLAQTLNNSAGKQRNDSRKYDTSDQCETSISKEEY